MVVSKQFQTPVLFIVFNKPESTKLVFEEIKKAKPKHLYIAADAPRKNNEKDKFACTEVQKIIKNVDWPCNVKYLLRKENLGCKIAESSAMDWFFENVEEGIILEDDCLPDQSFFKFCSELLEKYRYDERIMHISGNNFQRGFKRDSYSYYFSKYCYIWGWATWRRAWEKYDVNIKIYPELKKLGYLKNLYPNIIERLNHKSSLDLCYYKNFNTWDFQWNFSVLANNGLSIVPNKNLVQNIGMISGATHMTSFDKERSLKAETMGFPLVHPNFMVQNEKLDKRYFRWTLFKKVRNFLLRKTGLIKIFRIK